MQLKLVGVKPENWSRAAITASEFNVEHPDKVGFRHGVVYGYIDEVFRECFYIYRTKTQIVVRAI